MMLATVYYISIFISPSRQHKHYNKKHNTPNSKSTSNYCTLSYQYSKNTKGKKQITGLKSKVS